MTGCISGGAVASAQLGPSLLGATTDGVDSFRATQQPCSLTCRFDRPELAFLSSFILFFWRLFRLAVNSLFPPLLVVDTIPSFRHHGPRWRPSRSPSLLCLPFPRWLPTLTIFNYAPPFPFPRVSIPPPFLSSLSTRDISSPHPSYFPLAEVTPISIHLQLSSPHRPNYLSKLFYA